MRSPNLKHKNIIVKLHCLFFFFIIQTTVSVVIQITPMFHQAQPLLVKETWLNNQEETKWNSNSQLHFQRILRRSRSQPTRHSWKMPFASFLALTLSKLLLSPSFSTACMLTPCTNSEHTPWWYILGMLLIASNRKPNRPNGLNHKHIVCSLNRMPRNTWSQDRFRHSTVSSSGFCLSLHPMKLCPHACGLMVTRWLPQFQTSYPYIQHVQQEE